ncbi:MAG: hypothetical protein GEU77_01105 [Deltaproteobacteria bacterium]|nr:hypothetical protein [Deltaproteobacteria bacterium]
MNRSRKGKPPKDANQLATEIVRPSTEEPAKESPEEQSKRSPISEYLAEIGRKGGLKGGRARAKKLSKKQRLEIAQRAAQQRWKKHAEID